MIALQDFAPGAFGLVGTHAVYLRAPENDLGIPAFTLDGDLAVNPNLVAGSRAVRARLAEVGFDLRDLQSGLYERRDADIGVRRAARVDIFVPAAFEYAWSSEGYDARAAMVQPGLEACLVDCSPMELATLDDGGPRLTASVHVAGIVALLVAKGWKIGERYVQGPEAFAEVRKDISDIYRLLRASEPEYNATTLRVLRDNRHVRESVRTGSRHLRELCTAGGAGLREFSALLGSSVAARMATASLAVLVEEFGQTVDSVSAEM
ncbi:MAG TPA: hypothetical protein VGC72_15135 [Candidatus Elarobacter sp.]